MANSNFVVKNGLTVGALEIDAATGNITTTGTISGNLSTASIAKNDTSIALTDTGSGSDVSVTIDGSTIFNITADGIIPTINSDGTTGYSLGSPSFAWKDVFVSSGSLYVNGQKVLQEDSGNIVVSADANQNLVFQTSGSGNLELDPTGSGVILAKGTFQIQDGTNITNSAGNPVAVAVGVTTDSIISKTTNSNLNLSANGSGYVNVTGALRVGGDLTIAGTVTTINSETISLADNIIDLNSNFTTGTPTENAGFRVVRGDEAAVQVRWNEANDVWEFTTDGAAYGTIVAKSYVDSAISTSISDLTNGASAAFDTLKEIQDAMATDAELSAAIGAITTVQNANQWSTARTITLGGDLSGSVSVDGSANVTLTATIADDSHNHTIANIDGLQAELDGKLTAGATSGSGISGSADSGTFTVTSNATSANTGSTIVFRDASGNFSAGVMTGTATNARYADLAENYVGDRVYEAGTVVEFGGAEEITVAASGSTRIAGVISTAPGFLMNTGLKGATVMAVAFTGRVPCKVSGPVRKGDLMIAGPNGHAMRAPSEPKAGMVIGKALANFDGQNGVIEVAVGR
jgi:hypothetical protein